MIYINIYLYTDLFIFQSYILIIMPFLLLDIARPNLTLGRDSNDHACA